MSANNGSLFRAIRGPVTLIVVGSLFLADHLGYYEFHRTWPVILIVLGLLSLIARISPASGRGGGAS